MQRKISNHALWLPDGWAITRFKEVKISFFLT